ncbi:hypothetical protein FA15DRAFT_666055 [Coprinopsis marcescibilis]|uniref:Uncharacterized protein n=1 Tax=Coprinopsis marcescibilis TaxID=230819 RepID=A0A5C3L5J7_COPMA|nr:hypothetical protein FA15DRAFT_666055 [Coprinopsis marcescibilis]
MPPRLDKSPAKKPRPIGMMIYSSTSMPLAYGSGELSGLPSATFRRSSSSSSEINNIASISFPALPLQPSSPEPAVKPKSVHRLIRAFSNKSPKPNDHDINKNELPHLPPPKTSPFNRAFSFKKAVNRSRSISNVNEWVSAPLTNTALGKGSNVLRELEPLTPLTHEEQRNTRKHAFYFIPEMMDWDIHSDSGGYDLEGSYPESASSSISEFHIPELMYWKDIEKNPPSEGAPGSRMRNHLFDENLERRRF